MNPGTNWSAAFAVAVAGRSRRRFAALALILSILGVAACGTRPESGYLEPVAASAPGATDHTLLVATTRERDDRPGTYFNGERSPLLSYAEFTVSIPPNHVPSQMQLASSPPGDPATDFVVRDAALLDGDRAFLARLNAQLALRPRGERNVFIFVHGFNTTFAEGVFTTAQLAHELCARRACRCCSPGLRAAGRRNMSTTPTAPPRRATLSCTRCAWCFPATPRRSIFSRIRSAIG